MNPENVSIITGEKANRAEAKIPERIFLEALNPSSPTIKVVMVKKKILLHLAVERKPPLIGVNKLKKKGKNGGNSVTGVIVLFEFMITAPIPALILRAALKYAEESLKAQGPQLVDRKIK